MTMNCFTRKAIAIFLAVFMTLQSIAGNSTLFAEAGQENNPPVLNQIPDYIFSTGLLAEFDVTAEDPDGDSLEFFVEGLPPDATFENGHFSWTPEEIHIGEYELTFGVTDGIHITTQKIFFYVLSANDDVPLSSDVLGDFEEGSEGPEEGGTLGSGQGPTAPMGLEGQPFFSPQLGGAPEGGTGGGGTTGGGTGGGPTMVGNGVSQPGFYPTTGTGTGTGTTTGTGGTTGGTGGGTGDGSGEDGGSEPAQTSYTFADVASSVGIGGSLDTQSIAVGDVTGDGRMDLVAARTLGTYSIFSNNGNGTFSEIILLNLGSNPAGGTVALGDYNNDGRLDVFIARSGADYLLRNNGDGSFLDVTASAGVSSGGVSEGAIWADYNNDGWLDLFVVNSDITSALYKNLGDGTFQNVTASAGVQAGVSDHNRSAVFFDADNDGDLDLYVVNYQTANVFFVNQGNGLFQSSTGAGVSNNGFGVSATTGDFNNDGFSDLFVTNGSNTSSLLYQNNGNGTFSNVTTQTGIPALGLNPKGAAFVDFNNDGFLDLYVVRDGEQNIFLANDGAGKFSDMTQGTNMELPLTARQVASGDYNSDGMIDLFVAGSPSAVFRNDSPKTNNFIQVQTLGTRTNRPGIGAKLDLVSSSRRLIRTVREGASGSKESLTQNFGLGSSAAVDSFTIRWPSGAIQDVKSKITANRLNVIRENSAPELSASGDTTVNEGQKLTLNLTAQDPDNSRGINYDAIALSVEGAPANGTLRDNGDGTGTFEFNPDFSQAGQYFVTFRASDGDLSVSRTVQITVNNVTSNQGPTIGTLQNHTLNEGETLQFDVTGSDPDGDAISFSITAPSPQPRNASLAVDPVNAGIVHFTFAPDYEQAATYDFTFTVSDGFLSSSASSRITVGNTNRAPVLDPITDKTMNEGETLSFAVSGSDPDNDSISFNATGLPANATFDPATKTFTFNPDFDQAGDFVVKFQVSDGTLVTEQSVKITVGDVAKGAPKIPSLIDPGIASFSGKYTLRWSDESASGAKVYEVQESATSDFQAITRSFFPSGDYEPIVVTSSGTYFYRVRAYNDLPENGGVASDFSNVVNISVDLERGLDILNHFPNQGLVDGNPGSAQSSREIVTEPEGLGTLGAGNALKFNYDLKNQGLSGAYFENFGRAINIGQYKTINLRVRGDANAGYPYKLVIEMRKGGEFSSFVIFFKPTAQYQDFSFPFYQRTSEIDTVTVLVEDDVQGDGLGTLFIDEFFLSERAYVPNEKPSVTLTSGPSVSDEDLIDLAESQATHYFYDQVVGAGHVKDTDQKDFASIAATGFGLTALTILANRYDSNNANWSRVTPEQARQRAEAILDDIIRIQGLQAQDPSLYGTQGFLYHFINADGTRKSYSEVSSVDHALLVAGVLTAGEYFGGSLKTKADQIYMNTNWSFFLDTNTYLFSRAWSPGSGLSGVYDSYTDEILLLSLLAIGTDPENLNYLRSFYSFPRAQRSYQSPSGEEFRLVNSFFGSAFTYLYAHNWFDFELLGNDQPQRVSGKETVDSVNWWANSVQALRANRQFCIDRSSFFPFSFHSKSWGLSAVERPDNLYEGRYGAPPFNLGAHDGTIAVHIPVSAMPFFRTMNNENPGDNLGFQALRFYYNNFYQDLFCPYGLKESFDNDGNFSKTCLGIDKGQEAVMLENYRTRFIWDTFKKNERIKAATDKIFESTGGGGGDSFSAVLKNVADDQIASKFDFGTNPAGTSFVSSGQYIEVQYGLSTSSTAVSIFTNNTDYTGEGEGSGLVGQTEPTESVPMFWTVFDGIQTGGYAFKGDPAAEEAIQDKRRADFLSSDILRKRVIVDGADNLMPVHGRGTGSTPVYVYLGADFQNASAQSYRAAVEVEICHYS